MLYNKAMYLVNACGGKNPGKWARKHSMAYRGSFTDNRPSVQQQRLISAEKKAATLVRQTNFLLPL